MERTQIEWGIAAEIRAGELHLPIVRQLVAAAAFDVPGAARGGRFWEYVEVLQEFGALSFPSALPWAPGSRQRRLLVEGTVQATLLHIAGAIWPHLSDKVAHEKLRDILGGRALPEDTVEGTDEDQRSRAARDILAEFSAAHFLKQLGFRVDMTDGREDVYAEAPHVPALVVECKRPRDEKSLPRAVRHASEKLHGKRGCDGSARLGVIVVCVDRLLTDIPSVQPDLPGVPSFDTLAAATTWLNAVNRWQLERLVKMPECNLSPAVPFVMALMTVPIFARDEGHLRVQQVINFNATTRGVSPEAAKIVERLGIGPSTLAPGWRRRLPP